MIEIVWAEVAVAIEVINYSSDNWAGDNSWKLVFLMLVIVFFFLVSSLFFFHIYLACSGLTTWERWSWTKISYLNEWRKEWGSPFSKGKCANLKHFCCNFKTELQRWKMPKYAKNGPH
mmetsp:Transcript_13484/g.11550  ORF Transcript_13484/g.11550 Transcript_13484/m.11550 type:complete len:118 (-) Transcript_13484:13-366(-)